MVEDDDIKNFINKQKSLHLACILSQISDTNKKQLNEPHSSYTPFIYDKDKNKFYIYISNLAEHGKHLPTNRLISIMLIEDEQNCKNIFSRKRLSYSCTVETIPRNSELWVNIIEKFRQQFGKIMELLSQFNDFDLYCLKPQKGNYVQGFGKAYQIENGQITHIDSKK